MTRINVARFRPQLRLAAPRQAFGLTDGVVLEVSWIPPVRVSGVKANLWSFAVSRTVPINRARPDARA